MALEHVVAGKSVSAAPRLHEPVGISGAMIEPNTTGLRCVFAGVLGALLCTAVATLPNYLKPPVAEAKADLPPLVDRQPLQTFTQEVNGIMITVEPRVNKRLQNWRGERSDPTQDPDTSNDPSHAITIYRLSAQKTSNVTRETFAAAAQELLRTTVDPHEQSRAEGLATRTKPARFIPSNDHLLPPELVIVERFTGNRSTRGATKPSGTFRAAAEQAEVAAKTLI